jgi:hypothetical protein
MSTSGKRDEDRGEAGAEPPPQGGVLGNLPRTRPAVRSPRRAEERRRRKTEAATAAGGPEAKPGPAPERDAATAPSTAGEGPGSELESLARGGIAIAGGAASLGLRIAGRAAAALRDAVERR